MYKMSKAEQQAIAKYFEKRPILYIGGLGQVFSLQAGILLSQLLYWHGKGKLKGGWIFKTAAELRSELGMSRDNQETAIRQLVDYGVIDYKLAQVPARRHFRVNLQKLHELLPSLKETNKLHYPNPPNYFVASGETITKITRETTSKNTAALNRENYLAIKRQLVLRKDIRGP